MIGPPDERTRDFEETAEDREEKDARDVIREALGEYRSIIWKYGPEGDPMQLVDIFSTPGGGIADGKEELDRMADEIVMKLVNEGYIEPPEEDDG